MKKTKTSRVTLVMTPAEYDQLWDLLYAIGDLQRTRQQEEYLTEDDIAFAKAFTNSNPPAEQ